MPISVAPTTSPSPPEAASTPPTLPATAIGLAPRYQVRAVLWGNGKRFAVRDTASDTTIAIRTTRQIADSDIIRLNMAPRTDHGLRLHLRPMQTDPPSAQRDRQCGRCRGFFPPDTALDPTALQDWWLCDSCRNKLFRNSPRQLQLRGIDHLGGIPSSPAATPGPQRGKRGSAVVR